MIKILFALVLITFGVTYMSACVSFQRECTMDEWLVRTDCK